MDTENLEQEIYSLGKQLYEEAKVPLGGPFDPQYFTDKFLSWGMSDQELKVALFRFVDVIPCLDDSASVIRHVQEYFEPLKGRLPELLFKALAISPDSLTGKVVSRTIRKQIRYIAKRFIVGDTPKSALNTLKKIHQKQMAFTVDLVGEAALSEIEALDYQKRYLELLSTLSGAAESWGPNKLLDEHSAGPSPINISVKLSALYSQSKPVASSKSIEVLSERLATILSHAKKAGAFVNVDMEDSSLTDITLEIFKRTLEMNEFKDYSRCGIVLQAYLKRAEKDLDDVLQWVKNRDTPIAIRLVKGAYWDTETILAKQRNWPSPVWQTKSSSDANFEMLSRTLLDNVDIVLPAFGSHNIRSLCHAIKYAENQGITNDKYEIQTLYGMGESIKAAFTKRNLLVREYCPIGELIPAMGYLVRRLLENTANEGFLRMGFHDDVDPTELLAKPEFEEPEEIPQQPKFDNCPLLDFSIANNRSQIEDALSVLKNKVSSSPLEILPIVGGERLETQRQLESRSPDNNNLVLATQGLADVEIVEKSIQQLDSFLSSWQSTPVAERAEILIKTADVLERNRFEFIATIILEAGKPWIEADADVGEAIDFLNYYAEEAKSLFAPKKLGDHPGEENRFFYESRGIAAIISPWNFPLAIPCGMFAAALVTGNCAVLKPAEQTPLIAEMLFKAFLEAGLPANAAAFVPGLGHEVGQQLSSHPKINTIAFTGSKEVGLEIIEQGGLTQENSEHVKRVISEMGGKNAIIVDEDAELDEAIKGVVRSAFGFQGQKCSACSRVIAVGNCYPRFLERLASSTESLTVGLASEPSSFVGPVIDEDAFVRISETIEDAKNDCSILAEGLIPEKLKSNSNLIAPIIFTEIPENHSITREEIFGPVLGVYYAESFDEALSMALDSEFGLTGAVFSRSPKHIEKATKRFNVGNLYINRGCTGALVGRQPFGGAKMSGVGSKAGGPDYLLQFVVPRTVTENTMRRGFAPL